MPFMKKWGTDFFGSFKTLRTSTVDVHICARITLQLRDLADLKFMKRHHKAIVQTMLYAQLARPFFFPLLCINDEFLPLRDGKDPRVRGKYRVGAMRSFSPIPAHGLGICHLRITNTGANADGDYNAAWAWLLNIKKLKRTCERMDSKSLNHVIWTDGMSLSISLQERVYSSPPKKTLPTIEEIKIKVGWGMDPGRGTLIGARIDKCTTIEKAFKPATVSTQPPDYPDHDGGEYPRDEDDSDNLTIDPERPLFLDTFAADKLPISNFSMAGYPARKLNALKKRLGIGELESNLPERAYTYPAAVARLKVTFKHTHRLEEFHDLHWHRQQRFRAHHLRQEALSKMVNSLIPRGLTANEIHVAYGAASFSSSSPGSAPSINIGF
ncbi:hypothetical protein BDK51DRAFT_28551 [Blyttiomyces helicus]|uniref:Uncharacterized protein n=1 Tax=Blyttiomyces helicus TaxID=388810 RepID=A0A4P9VYN3_9FUNG|nr:hypothetical protein BDK51DRAFT_28551 [Blyttiomyces helicus]|eukprot:RKO83418.1 hypothetical protein BDK51DRAFT_28551 [Blyttiomyces helicus]